MVTTTVAQLIAKGERKIVIGLGQTGLSCVRFLKSHGYEVAVFDTRSQPPGEDELKDQWPDVELVKGPLNPELWSTGQELIVSPGISVQQGAIAEAIEKGCTAIGDVELFCRETTKPVVAITGSNAKSTVTDLVGKMVVAAGVKGQVGGNIGTPVLELLEKDSETELYVLELSSFQLETTPSLRAETAVILNVSEDHMDRYDSLADYRQAKHNIYKGCKKAIFNREDPLTAPLLPSNVTAVTFGLNAPDLKQFGMIEEDGEPYLAKGIQPLMKVSDLKLTGLHNAANALAALAIGESVGLPMQAMLEVLTSYRGLPYRCELIGEWKGAAWFNDSKGTNVGATVAAINGLAASGKGNLILIAGGVGKGADFSPLVQPVKQHVSQVILFGEDKAIIRAALKELNDEQCQQVADLEAAMKLAANFVQASDTVLFSPACASFDMFANYMARGQAFNEIFEEMSRQS